MYKSLVNVVGENTKQYTGATETKFKIRQSNHNQTFKNPGRRNETKLANYIWDLKEENKSFQISWKLHRQSVPYQCGSRKCDLCLSEKYDILKSDPKTSINKRSEILNYCRHRAKFKLKNV